MRTPELVIPGGSIEAVRVALLYGADAVYVGLPDRSLRTQAKLTFNDAIAARELTRKRGKRLYIAFNIFSHNRDLRELPEIIETIDEINPDGLIVADPGIFRRIQAALPGLALHVSTQANICSTATVEFWRDMGAAACVLAREVPFADIREIRKDCPDVRLEMFVHGAMCMSYSGRCLISSYLTGRSANRGRCTQSCRWSYTLHEAIEPRQYALEEAKRPGERMPIIEDERGTYLMSSKDLCLIRRLPQIIECGIDMLKVEGRTKSPHYVAVVTRAYRAALDAYANDPDGFDFRAYAAELNTLQHRGYTEAFFDGLPGPDAQTYDTPASTSDWRTAGFVRTHHEDGLTFELRNTVKTGDVIELLTPGGLETVSLQLSPLLCAQTRAPITQRAAGQHHAIYLPAAHLPQDWRTTCPVLTHARKRYDGTCPG